MSESKYETGLVIQMEPQKLLVRLDDGREIATRIPKERKFGCLFSSMVGIKVKIAVQPAPKMSHIISILDSE
jgi:hypothetical protein